MALSAEAVSSIVSKISYKDWAFRVMPKGDGFLFQWMFLIPDVNSGKMEWQKCRKWWISSHACEGEIVRTAFKAAEAAELHELQENFKYCGQPIFDPHLHPEDLSTLLSMNWIGRSVRTSEPLLDPRKYLNAFRGAVREAKAENAKLAAKKGRKTKPRNGVKNGTRQRKS